LKEKRIKLFRFIFLLNLFTKQKAMETIRIQFQTNLKSKILELLRSFPEDEVQIIQEDPYFEKNKAILEKELEDIKNGKSKCISMEELEMVLEKIITKYEN